MSLWNTTANAVSFFVLGAFVLALSVSFAQSYVI